MTIQGILSDMYTTLGVDLQDSTATEARRNAAFENYMHEKTKELAELKVILAKKQKEKRPRPGLGPSPGWGPVRVGAHMGLYGPIRALMGL